VGLDAAGKTTALYKLKSGAVPATAPTLGFNVETVSHRGAALNVVDMGTRGHIRHLWPHFYPGTRAVVLVVDATDRARLPESRRELEALLAVEELRGAPLLVWANKQDLPSAMPTGEVADGLGLAALEGREWHVQPTRATAPADTDDGLRGGLDWLVAAVGRRAE
jgi:small GTP-binding protein